MYKPISLSLSLYIYIYIYIYICVLIYFSGPEMPKRKRATRQAGAFGYPFQLTHFSLPISGPLNMQ